MAFHITWGTYGARLHGSNKPHVDHDHNQYGAPLAPTDPARESASRDRMKGKKVELTIEQRNEVERAIREVAARYGWTIHAIAVQRDHVHVVVTAFREGTQLRDALKAVASRALNKNFGQRTWCAEGGRSKFLWEREYFAHARDYVSDQRDW